MSKLGRFSLGVVVTIVLLASLMLTAASVMALPDLPDPGNPGPVLPPPALATATPTPVPEEEEEDQDEDGDEDEDDDPEEPAATATPTPRATTPTQGASPTTTRTTTTSRTNSRGACVTYSSYNSDNVNFPALHIPGVGTISAQNIGQLLGATDAYFTNLNYGNGVFNIEKLSDHCSSVQERYRYKMPYLCVGFDDDGNRHQVRIVGSSCDHLDASHLSEDGYHLQRDHARITLDKPFAGFDRVCLRDSYATTGTPAIWTSVGSAYCIRYHPKGASWH